MLCGQGEAAPEEKHERSDPGQYQPRVRRSAAVVDGHGGGADDEGEDNLPRDPHRPGPEGATGRATAVRVAFIRAEEVPGVEDRLVDQDVQQTGGVGLDHEEEQLLDGDREGDGAQHGVRRVGPYPTTDEVRVPRDGRRDGDLSSATAVSAAATVTVVAAASRRIDDDDGSEVGDRPYTYQPRGLVQIERGPQRTMQVRERDGRRDGVLDMPVTRTLAPSGCLLPSFSASSPSSPSLPRSHAIRPPPPPPPSPASAGQSTRLTYTSA